MAQKYGFFNAKMFAGLPDRQYNANDYCDNLAVVISNGVLRSAADDLKPTSNGLIVSIAAGRAWINGHWYHNTATWTQEITPPVSGSRLDSIFLRLDTGVEQRNLTLVYRAGTAAADPVHPAIVRSGSIYELRIADILVAAGASGVTVTDYRSNTTDCGWVYSVVGDGSFFTSLDSEFVDWFEGVKDTLSSVTLFKRYSYEVTLSSSSATVTFNIPQYDAETCFIDVFVNGFNTTDYTVSGSTITFPSALSAGTDVLVYAYKSLDGTDIESVSDEITELQTQMAALNGVSHFTYKATGTDDNISLSQIMYAIMAHEYDPTQVTTAADAFLSALGGNTWLAALSGDAHVTIHVLGTLGVTTPATITSAESYWFDPEGTQHSTAHITLDFADADEISITGASGVNYVVFSHNQYSFSVKNADIRFSGSNSGNVYLFKGAYGDGFLTVENCSFNVHAGAVACIGTHGTFTNCEGVCVSEGGNAVCFAPSDANLVTVIGGKYKAYAKASGTISAVLYTAVGETNAVVVADLLNCPTETKSGYTQGYVAVGNAGTIYATTVVSPLTTTGSNVTITNIISANKP